MIVLVSLINLCMYSGRLVCLNTYRKSSKNEVFNGTKIIKKKKKKTTMENAL